MKCLKTLDNLGKISEVSLEMETEKEFVLLTLKCKISVRCCEIGNHAELIREAVNGTFFRLH